MKDYRLEIKIRNNAVLKRIDEMGYDSIPAFCRDKKLNYNTVNDVIAFKVPFYTKRGDISLIVVKLADALQLLPEHIYPPERREAPLAKNRYTIEASKNDLMQISSSLRRDALPVDDRKMLDNFAPTIQKIMNEQLSPREKEILDRRFGITSGQEETLDEVAKGMKSSRERIRQIEARAIRKLKDPFVSRELREYQDFLDDINSR